MQLSITSTFDVSIETARDHILTSRLMKYIAAPLIRFGAADGQPLPEDWSPGHHPCMLWLFGCVPLGRQTIGLSIPSGCDEPGQRVYYIRDNGFGTLASVWDHLVTMREAGPEKTVYTDSLTIRAGLLTPLVYLFAQVFYRYRQRRWQKLVREGFRPLTETKRTPDLVGPDASPACVTDR